jgi:lysyl-tRNA synthetase class 2
MYLTNNPSIQEVLFFPQMKPENTVSVELNDEEQLVFDLLKKEEKMDLNVLKEQAGLSNKKWDKSIKGLTGKTVAKVEKTEEGLFVKIL